MSIIKKLITFAVIFTMMFSMISCAKSDNIELNNSEKETNKDIIIETDYVTLLYPNENENRLKIEKFQQAVNFYYKNDDIDILLFTVRFDNDEAIEVRKIMTENGDVKSVGIISYDLVFHDDFDDEEKALAMRMQDDLNYLIDNLPVQSYTIETPYASLNYDEKWIKYIRTEIIDESNYTIKFYGAIPNREELQLFDVIFGSQTDNLIGQLKSPNGTIVNVSVITYGLSVVENWNDEEKYEIYAMSEEINNIIRSISENSNFIN